MAFTCTHHNSPKQNTGKRTSMIYVQLICKTKTSVFKPVGGAISTIGVLFGSRPPARNFHNFNNRMFPSENLIKPKL